MTWDLSPARADKRDKDSASRSPKTTKFKSTFVADLQLLESNDDTPGVGEREHAAILRACGGRARDVDPLAFSALGVLNVFRQHFCLEGDAEASITAGPIEHIFSIGPLETVEVRQETTLRRTFEQSQESSSSQAAEVTQEDRQSDELTARFIESYQRTTSSTIAASVSGSYAFISGSVSGSKSWTASDTASRESASRNVTDALRRTAETFNKTFAVRIRSSEEFQETNTYRKVISNTTPTTVNYGLQRYWQQYSVKNQRFAKKLAWHFIIATPSNIIRSSSLVSTNKRTRDALPLQESTLVTLPLAGFSSVTFAAADTKVTGGWGGKLLNESNPVLVTFPLSSAASAKGAGFDTPGSFRAMIKLVNPEAPSQFWIETFEISHVEKSKDEVDGLSTFSVQFSRVGRAEPVGDTTWIVEPDPRKLQSEFQRRIVLSYFPTAPAQGSTDVAAYANYLDEQRLAAKRAPADLRKEEIRALQSQVFLKLDVTDEDIVKRAHRIQELSSLFDFEQLVYVAAEPAGVRAATYPYETTVKSAQPFGASLGWTLQIDADDQRNEFLNASSIRVCVPIRPGSERAAIERLRELKLLSGGVDGDLLCKIEERRAAERYAADQGLSPEDVPIDTPPTFIEPPIDKDKIETIYPIVASTLTHIPVPGFSLKVLDAKKK